MSNAIVANSQMTESERLDLEKRRLECEKLRAEIAQVSYPWWKRAGYIGSLVPIVIALVGFLSAFASGYFDTERKQLKTEIDGLTLKRNQLEAANDEIQKKIDDAYLKLKIASSEARYALSHISSMPIRKETVANLESSLAAMPPKTAAPLREVLSMYVLANDLAKTTQKDLEDLEKNLQAIPASKWVVELKPTLKGMYVPGKAFLEAPDGRFYDPHERRYYDKDEFSKKKAGK
jgi:hypothetical protein